MDLYPEEVILEYIKEHITKDDYKYSSDGKWINVNSEFTSDDKKCMGFNIETNFVNDFKTGSMSLIKFVMEHNNCGEIKANELLMKIATKLMREKKLGKMRKSGIIKPDIVQPIELSEIRKIPEMSSFEKELSNIGRVSLKYLIKRGIGPRHIKKFNLHYSDATKCWYCHGTGFNEDDEFCDLCNGTGYNQYYNKVIIPTYEKGKLIYFQGRNLNETNELRYMNPKLPRMQVVYFYDLLKENDDIYITEGPFDAMTLLDYSCTCLMSMKMSDPQILKIVQKNPKRIIFIPQHDKTVEKRETAKKNIESNINRIIKLTNNQIPIGIYRWHSALMDNIKDINDAKITFIDEEKIEMRNNENKKNNQLYDTYSTIEQSHISENFVLNYTKRLEE